MTHNVSTWIKIVLNVLCLNITASLLAGCAQKASENSNKAKASYIPVAFQKKKNPKPISRKIFFKLYGEYTIKSSTPFPPPTKVYVAICGKYVCIDISIAPGCYIRKRGLEFSFRNSPFTKFPLQVNKYYQVFKIFDYDKKSYFYSSSNFTLVKFYAKQVKFRFPIKLLLKYPNKLEFIHRGICYNKQQHKRKFNFNDHKKIVYNVKEKTITLVKPKDRIGMGDPDGPF